MNRPHAFFVTVVLISGSVLPFSVCEGQGRERLPNTLQPLRSDEADAFSLKIRGGVRFADGRPVAGARVGLIPVLSNFQRLSRVAEGQGDWAALRESATDDRGRYELGAPHPGLWRLRISLAGHLPMESPALPVTEDLELAPLVLPRAESVAVRVVSADRRGAPGVWVHARGMVGEKGGSPWPEGWFPAPRLGSTDASGEVRFPRADVEVLEVNAFSPVAGRGRVAGVVGAAEVVLPPAPARRRLVRVLEPGGAPVVGLRIAAGDPAWPVGLTDGEGRATLRQDASGASDLQLFAADGRRWRVRTVPLEPRQEGPEPETIIFPAREILSGRVVEKSSGGGIEGALVWPRHDPGTFVRSDGEGRYELTLPPYERFSVFGRGAGLVERSVKARGGAGASGRAPLLALERSRRGFGLVLDAGDRPVPGARVRLAAAAAAAAGRGDGAPAVEVVTDREGAFRVSELPGRRLDIEASSEGFSTLRVRGVEVPRDGAPTPAPADLGTLVLVPGALLTGRVTEASGEPIEGAQLRLRDAEEARSTAPGEAFRGLPVGAISGARGKFQVRDLEAGRRFLLEVRHEAFLPTVLRDVEAPSGKPLVVVLEPAAGVRGRVETASGEPVADALVAIHAAPLAVGVVEPQGRRQESSRSTVTDETGTFRFSGLVPGELEIYAQAEGYRRSSRERVAVAPKEEVRGLVLTLERGSILDGRVVSEGGEAVAQARIRLAAQRTVSDGAGRFRLSGLPSGLETLRIEHGAFQRLDQRLYVEPGENVLEFVLRRGLSISGRVVDPAGEGVPGARVLFEGRNWRDPRSFEALTGQDGAFSVSGVVDGAYDLEARAPGFAVTDREDALRVDGEGIEGLEVVLEAGSRVFGRILGLGFDELMGAEVSAENGGATRRGTLDHGGRFEVTDLGTGSWLLKASVQGGRRETSRRIAVKSGGESLQRDLVFDGVSLAGAVTYDGQPLPETTVTVTGRGIADRRSVVTDYRGAFEIRDLEPAEYRLSVSNPRELLNHSRDVAVFGHREIRVDLRSAAVSGRVVTAEGSRPIAAALLIFTQLLGEGEIGSMVSLVADEQGTFRVARLTPGRYRLEARKDSYAPAERILEVRGGDDREGLEIPLEATEGVEISVRLASGRTPESLLLNVFDPAGRRIFAELRVGLSGGAARFPTVPPGTWELLISTPGGAATRVPATVPGPPVEVVLPAAGRLRVQVGALAESNLLATLRLADAQGAPFEAVDGAGRPQREWQVTGGTAVVENLPAGTWSLEVIASDGQVWLGSATTTGGPWAEAGL